MPHLASALPPLVYLIHSWHLLCCESLEKLSRFHGAALPLSTSVMANGPHGEKEKKRTHMRE